MEVHEDILYDALHMQIPIALLDLDTFERVYNDLQLAASRAYPFKQDGTEDKYPWYFYFVKNWTGVSAGGMRISAPSVAATEQLAAVGAATDVQSERQQELLDVVGSTGDLNKRVFRGVLLTPDDIGRQLVHPSKIRWNRIDGGESEDSRSSGTSSLQSLQAIAASEGNALWMEMWENGPLGGANMFEQPQNPNRFPRENAHDESER